MDLDYTLALSYVCILISCMEMLKQDYKSAHINVPLHSSMIFQTFEVVSFILVIASLIDRMFKDNLFAIIGYIAIFIVVWLINGLTLYRIYRAIFGRYLIGSIIPMILLIPALVYLMKVW